MTINNRGLRGQPNLPYVDNRSYAGSDVFIDFTFLDHTGAAVTPVSITYQLDDISNVYNMIPSTSLTPTGPTQTLQIPGAKMIMTYPAVAQGSQICQLLVTAVLSDTSTVKSISIIELVAIQTP